MNYRNKVQEFADKAPITGIPIAPKPYNNEPLVQTPQIERGAERVSDARVRLSSLIAELEKRLNPVLRPVDEGKQLAANPREVMSTLAAALYDHASELDELCSRLSSLCDRIEL